MQLDTGLHTGGVGTAPFKLVGKGCSSIQSCTLVGWVQLPSSWWGGDAARYRAAHWWGGYSSLQAGEEGMQLDTGLHTGGVGTAPFKLVGKGCSSIQGCTLVGWVQLPSSW